jgi:hypothetical protein
MVQHPMPVTGNQGLPITWHAPLPQSVVARRHRRRTRRPEHVLSESPSNADHGAAVTAFVASPLTTNRQPSIMSNATA